MIKIGITGGILPRDTKRNIFTEKELCYVEKDFANYWASFGVLPVLIPDLKEKYLTAFLSQLDALAMMGGTDIAPAAYGEQPIGPWKGDPQRDQYELRILDWFVKNDYPVFGICRGFQLLNVYFGGTLYQDLPTQFPSDTVHADKQLYDLNLHKIRVKSSELLDELGVGRRSLLVNSLHHQGLKELAEDLVPIAWSEDGLIEAFYHSKVTKGKIMGLQWHPEFFEHSEEILMEDRGIIEHFLAICEDPDLNKGKIPKNII